jgi:hypothetical protein
MSKYDGVHSCGPNCTQPLCVANRQIAELTEDRDLYKATCMANDALIAQLQAKVAELTDRIKWLEINWCNPNGEGE